MKLPRSWIEAGNKPEPKAPEPVQAAIKMDREEGVCPACESQMEGPVFCSGKPMHICWNCRIALPMKDELHQQHQQGYQPYEENMFGR